MQPTNLVLAEASIVTGRVHSLPTLLGEGIIRVISGNGTIQQVRFWHEGRRKIESLGNRLEMTSLTEGRLMEGEGVIVIRNGESDSAMWWGTKSEYDEALAKTKQNEARELATPKRPPIHASLPGRADRLVLR